MVMVMANAQFVDERSNMAGTITVDTVEQRWGDINGK